MGWKNQPTTMVMFENCRVPQENLVGTEGHGFRYALKALNGGRVNIGESPKTYYFRFEDVSILTLNSQLLSWRSRLRFG